MVISRSCKEQKQDGSPCGSPPLQDGEYCYMHSPEHAAEMQEARRAGGLNKRRERTLSVVYEFEGLGSIEQIRRLFEIAGFEALALPAGPNKVRVIIQVGLAAMKALGVGDHEERLQEIEAVLGSRPKARRP